MDNLHIYTKETQPRARDSYTSSTLAGTDPHTWVESNLHRHPYTMKLKNKFRFGPPLDTPLLLMWLIKRTQIIQTNLEVAFTLKISDWFS